MVACEQFLVVLLLELYLFLLVDTDNVLGAIGLVLLAWIIRRKYFEYFIRLFFFVSFDVVGSVDLRHLDWILQINKTHDLNSILRLRIESI